MCEVRQASSESVHTNAKSSQTSMTVGGFALVGYFGSISPENKKLIYFIPFRWKELPDMLTDMLQLEEIMFQRALKDA